MRLWRTLHQWMGLSAAVFFVVTAVTGGLLEIGEIDARPAPTLPDELVRPPIEASEIIRIAERESERGVSILTISRGDRQMWVAQLEDGAKLFLGPGGTVVEERPLPFYTPLLAFAVSLHTGQIAGKAGHVVMLAVSMALAGSLVTGILIWPWLRRRMKRS